jgi:integral membrane protein (TIGR01906 family)
MNQIVVRCAVVLGSVALVLIIICSAFSSFIFNHRFYHQEYVKNGVYAHLDVNTSRDITVNLFDYVHGKDSLHYFTPAEQSHLADVKSLIQAGFLVYGLAIIILVLCIVFLVREQVVRVKKRLVYTRAVKSISKMLLAAAIITLVLVVILALLSSSDFSGVFSAFHQVFFPQGNYTFPDDSLLITLFPQQFFQDIAQHIAVQVVITAGIIAIVAGSVLWVLRTKKTFTRPRGFRP